MTTITAPALSVALPVSEEAESAVIGSLLIDPETFGGLQTYLRASDFYLLRHAILWQTFERMTANGLPIDMTTVAIDLQQNGTFDDVGGYGGLIALTQVPANSMHAEAYAKLVQRLSQRRLMIEAADAVRRSATDEATNIDMAIAAFERVGIDLRRRQMAVDTPMRTMEEATRAKYAALIEAKKRFAENPAYVLGVRTGLKDLDKLLDGLRPGITTLAAQTGVGKTGMTLQMARFASLFGLLHGLAAQPAKTLFFSGEMTDDQLMNRLLSSMTGIPVRHIERGSISAEQQGMIVDAMHDLDTAHRLTFESGKRLNTSQIRQRVRTLVADGELDLLILDGLLQIDELKQADKRGQTIRRDVIEFVMNDLEDIALTYNLPILLTHQLSRASGSRADKRPILSDLAEASFVEQKSAVILFLYRPGYHDPNADPNAATVIVAKNRHGETGDIAQIYDRQYTRFADADVQHISLGGN